MSYYQQQIESQAKGQKLLTLQSSRAFGKTAQRPPVPIDPTSLTRIYKETCQRVKLSIESLRTNAVFLLACDEDKQVIAWFGVGSDSVDREIALRVGLEIAVKDYGIENIEEIPVILEELERSIQLRYFLDKLWEDESNYKSKNNAAALARKQPVVNSPAIVYVLEKLYDEYLLKEVKRSEVREDGSVGRVAFAPVDKSTIVAVCVGDQWDLWVARGAIAELDQAQAFMSNYISSQISNVSTDIENSFDLFQTSQNLRVVMQGCERRLFRLTFKLLTDFEPSGRTIPYVPLKEEYNPNASFKTNKPAIKPNNDTDIDDLPLVPEAIGLDEVSPKNTDTALNKKAVKFGETPVDAAGANNNPEEVQEVKPEQKIDPQDKKRNPGKYLLSEEAMKFREEENVGPDVRVELIEKSSTNPKILVGWQIEIDEGEYAGGVRVITGTRKTLFSKTEYRVSRRNFDPNVDSLSSNFDDVWLRLKRLRTKGGLSFRPLRRVLTLGSVIAVPEDEEQGN